MHISTRSALHLAPIPNIVCMPALTAGEKKKATFQLVVAHETWACRVYLHRAASALHLSLDCAYCNHGTLDIYLPAKPCV